MKRALHYINPEEPMLKQARLRRIKELTFDQKKERCLVDVNGCPWDDIFFHMWSTGIACGQNHDFNGFTFLLAIRFPDVVVYHDLCPCKLSKKVETWNNSAIHTFVFPKPGICKQLWTVKPLFAMNSSYKQRFVTAGKTYRVPGKIELWSDYTIGGIGEAYKCLTVQMVNTLAWQKNADENPFIQSRWEKDPFLEGIHVNSDEKAVYKTFPDDEILFDDNGDVCCIWSSIGHCVTEERRWDIKNADVVKTLRLIN